jgi:hypothetical protein
MLRRDAHAEVKKTTVLLTSAFHFSNFEDSILDRSGASAVFGVCLAENGHLPKANINLQEVACSSLSQF